MGTLSDSLIHPTTGKCSGCDSIVKNDDVLKCKTCELTFHPLCSALTALSVRGTQCTKTFLTLFNAKSTSKPNFSWKCDKCMISQDAANKADLAQIVHSLTLKVESLTATLNDFRQETAQDIYEQHRLLYNTFNKLKDDIKQNITSIQPPVLQSSTQGNPWANTRATQKLRSSFLVKPTTSGTADM